MNETQYKRITFKKAVLLEYGNMLHSYMGLLDVAKQKSAVNLQSQLDNDYKIIRSVHYESKLIELELNWRLRSSNYIIELKIKNPSEIKNYYDFESSFPIITLLTRRSRNAKNTLAHITDDLKNCSSLLDNLISD